MFKPDKNHSNRVYCAFPGSESIQFDMEKLFLIAVSKENLDFIGKIQKNIPYNIFEHSNYWRGFGRFWGGFST